VKHIIKQFTQREAQPVIQFIKYGIGGCTSAVVDITIFYVLCIWIIPALAPGDLIFRVLPFDVDIPTITDAMRSNRFVINSIIAFMFSNMTSYIINIIWVFEPGRHKWYIELGLFYLVSGISICVGTLIGYVAIQFFGLSTTVSFFAKAIASLLLNYVCRKFFIFKR